MRTAFCEREPVEYEKQKFTDILSFPVPFHSSKLVYFIENWFWEKEILSFHLRKIYLAFLKR